MTSRFLTCTIPLMFIFFSSLLFADTETKGFKLGEIKKIDIDNTNGDVEFVTSTNDQVVVSYEKENCSKEYLLLIEQKGDTLAIKSEKNTNISWWDRFFGDSDWNCTIHIALTIPKDISVKYKAISGNLSAEGFKGSLNFDVVSGDIDIASGEISDLQGKSVSGEIRAVGLTSSAQVEVVSGDVMLRYAKSPQNGRLEIKSISSDAVVFLPPDATFSSDFSATSGEFKNDFSDIKDATFKIAFKSVSGNLEISKSE